MTPKTAEENPMDPHDPEGRSNPSAPRKLAAAPDAPDARAAPDAPSATSREPSAVPPDAERAGGLLPPSRAVALAAALAAVGAVALVAQALGEEARQTGSGFVTYLLLAAAVEGSCAIGFRLRRRWALAAYMSYFPLHQLILAAVATWSPLGFVLRLTVVLLGFARLSRLR